jgi:hypothetical protein
MSSFRLVPQTQRSIQRQSALNWVQSRLADEPMALDGLTANG